MKYKIRKEFFPFSHFTPPISEKFLVFVNYRLAPEHLHPVKFLFQMLPYPYLDARGTSESCKKIHGYADVEFFAVGSHRTYDEG